jgi:hypothetical protein
VAENAVAPIICYERADLLGGSARPILAESRNDVLTCIPGEKRGDIRQKPGDLQCVVEFTRGLLNRTTGQLIECEFCDAGKIELRRKKSRVLLHLRVGEIAGRCDDRYVEARVAKCYGKPSLAESP